MKFSNRSLAAAFSTLAVTLLVAAPARAQSTHTFVSVTGDDGADCSRITPCRTFSNAIGKTALNGEISCVDAGNFGVLTIVKSITIDCHDVFATINNFAAIGISW